MIKLLAIAALTVSTLPGQALTICSLVTTEDASAILGVAAKRTQDPSGCGWEDATHKNQLNVAYVTVAAMFERARADSSKKGKVEDEKGLGGPAFSSIPTASNGTKAAVYCLKGSTVLILDAEAPAAASRIPQMREVMRKLVPK
jgi:hypothetical protein